jgi:hypothetical protein
MLRRGAGCGAISDGPWFSSMVMVLSLLSLNDENSMKSSPREGIDIKGRA